MSSLLFYNHVRLELNNFISSVSILINVFNDDDGGVDDESLCSWLRNSETISPPLQRGHLLLLHGFSTSDDDSDK